MTALISKEELHDLQIVHLDPVGDTYEYKGKIIRIIRKSARRHVKTLMDSGLIKKLVQDGLFVETHISDYVYEEDGMVLEHQKIIPPQTCSQWTFSMMRDAAKLVLKINIICMEYGYELKDCHQANILFNGVNPVYVDFGSIVKKRGNEGEWTARREFLKWYYYPLKLWSRGYEVVVGNLNIREMISIYYHIPLVAVGPMESITPVWKEKSAVDEMKGFIAKLDRLKYQSNTKWGEYQNSYWKKGSGNPRFNHEIDWINQNQDIESMIEVGANQGNFSYLAATGTKLQRIVATDYDKKAVDIMYQRLKSETGIYNKITPLLLDFIWMPLEQLARYCSDLVVANALTHHLILTQGMSMKAVTERLAVLTNKYVIVEFMEKGVKRSKSGLPKWYTLDRFLESLRVEFSIIDICKIDARVMIIGKKNGYERQI